MADQNHGNQDITEQQKTFTGFMRYTVWTCVIVVLILMFLAIVGNLIPTHLAALERLPPDGSSFHTRLKTRGAEGETAP